MAPLTRSVYFQLPELPLDMPLDSPRVESKDIQASSYPIALANPEIPRLVTYRSKSGICSSCSKTSKLSCVDCCGMVFYCNADCQTAHWPIHKDVCQSLKVQHLSEVMEARIEMSLNQITEDIGKIISSDFKSLNYKEDPKLSVKIDDSAKIGDFYCVSSDTFDSRILHVHPGTYKCTSVTIDESCAPVTIYHHESVDPAKIMKQCILMSKDLFDHFGMCYDEEYIPCDTESEASDSEEMEASGSETSDSETSDSEASEVSGSEASEVSGSEVSEASGSEASDVSEASSDLVYAEFVGKVFDDTSAMETDSADQAYNPSESDSDCSSLDQSEVYYLIAQSKQYIRDIKQESICYFCGRYKVEEDFESDTDSEVSSEYEDSEYYTDSEVSSDNDYCECDMHSEISSDSDSQDDSQDDYQYESQDEGSQASDSTDEELSWEEQLYEEFKYEVFKSPKKLRDNNDIVFFMNSQYTSSVKDILDSGKIENGSEIAGSFILKDESESSGIAVDVKSQNWLAHAFRDSTSEKCFALIISTDNWEHLSNNHEHLEAHYPDQKWTSVAETNYHFQMKDFVY